MKYIVTMEHRPFSYKDFIDYMKHGTFRNKISKLRRDGLVEFVRNSHTAFYTLRGYHFGNNASMTRNHMGISSVTPVTNVIPYTAVTEAESFFGYLKTLDGNTNSIHDIHTKFTVLDIYKIMSSNPKYSKLINPVSKDIPLEADGLADTHISFSIDGIPFDGKLQTDINKFKVQPIFFNVSYSNGNYLSTGGEYTPGKNYKSIIGAYTIILEPLPLGKHTIAFDVISGGCTENDPSCSPYHVNVKYNLIVI